MITDQNIDRMVLISSILDLVKDYNDFDEFMEEVYDTEEYYEAISDTIRWAIEYNEKYRKK